MRRVREGRDEGERKGGKREIRQSVWREGKRKGNTRAGQRFKKGFSD